MHVAQHQNRGQWGRLPRTSSIPMLGLLRFRPIRIRTPKETHVFVEFQRAIPIHCVNREQPSSSVAVKSQAFHKFNQPRTNTPRLPFFVRGKLGNPDGGKGTEIALKRQAQFAQFEGR